MGVSGREIAIGILGFVVGSGAATQIGRAQDANSFNGTLSHVGIVVRDVDRAARVFGDVFDAEVPPPAVSPIIPFPSGVSDATTTVKITSFTKGNVRLELIQPLEDPSPWREFLERRGEGVHHLAFDMDNDYGTIVKWLQSKGGTWNLGTEEVNFAYVDMTPQLGMTLEVFGPGGPQLP